MFGKRAVLGVLFLWGCSGAAPDSGYSEGATSLAAGGVPGSGGSAGASPVAPRGAAAGSVAFAGAATATAGAGGEMSALGGASGAASSAGAGGLSSNGGASSEGGSSGAGQGGSASGGSPGGPDDPPPSGDPVVLRFMSLNIYGYATMPDAAPDYAALVNGRDIDVLGIQEGVNDWQIPGPLPTDYSRADQLGAALGDCWQQSYQVYVNTCRGVSLDSHERFDLTDGPNATRTGEAAWISKDGAQILFINVHWDHESGETRVQNASETASFANQSPAFPAVILGDFNSGCTGAEVSQTREQAGATLIADGGIDCILSRGLDGEGETFNAAPSDHPGVAATLTANP